jgi:serine/threonine-protein kinase RsbT
MDEIRIPIANEVDIVAARHQGRTLGSKLGFSSSEQTLIATAISEIARNIVTYARQGHITFSIVEALPKQGVQIVAEDEGPGIADISLALQDGYSSNKSLGLGLPGAKRLMDEFEIDSQLGRGTTIKMIKWKHRK